MAGIISTGIIVSLLWVNRDRLPPSFIFALPPIVAVLTTFSTTLLFVTGGLLGDRIEMRKSKLGKSQRDAETQEHVRETARRITGSDRGHSYQAIVEILKVLQPFVPVITGLLGIIGPILLYMLKIK
jgi:hypothetical protein